MKLDKIGPKYAQRIIDYRENVQPFKTPEEIMKVKGIGPKTLEANKGRITVQ
jgi:competence protein ComEA